MNWTESRIWTLESLITFQLRWALNCTYFMHQWFWPQHRIQRPGGGEGGRCEKHEIYVAAFGGHLFYDLFVQGWGGMAPSAPPWIRYWTNSSNYMKVSLFWKILECLFHVLVDLLTFLPVFWAGAYTFYKRSQQWSFFVTLFLIFKLVLFLNLKLGDFPRFMVYFHIVMGSDDSCFSLILRGRGVL